MRFIIFVTTHHYDLDLCVCVCILKYAGGKKFKIKKEFQIVLMFLK